MPVETLTVFGFAAANWQRSRREIDHLLHLLEVRLSGIAPRCTEAGIAVEVIGRRDRLPDSLLVAIADIEQATVAGSRRLRVAVDYSSRETILNAARDLPVTGSDAEFSARVAGSGQSAEVDLLIRTGREQRLSDFLLWECAFAELYFPDVHWPDFKPSILEEALIWYGQRQRRMGR
jgi:undecaprenyl diphosphate synthase